MKAFLCGINVLALLRTSFGKSCGALWLGVVTHIYCCTSHQLKAMSFCYLAQTSVQKNNPISNKGSFDHLPGFSFFFLWFLALSQMDT